MTLPNPGFTSEQLAAELGIGHSFSENNQRVLNLLADRALPYNSEDLAGRQAWYPIINGNTIYVPPQGGQATGTLTASVILGSNSSGQRTYLWLNAIDGQIISGGNSVTVTLDADDPGIRPTTTTVRVTCQVTDTVLGETKEVVGMLTVEWQSP